MATRSAISGTRNSISRDARKAFRIDGLSELQDNVAKVLNAVTGKQVKKVYLEGAVMVRDQARKNAPYDETRDKGTHLRDAIFANQGDPAEPNALLGVRYKTPGAPHAHLMEYGWINKPEGSPYFRKAIAEAGPRASQHIRDGLIQIIESAPKK